MKMVKIIEVELPFPGPQTKDQEKANLDAVQQAIANAQSNGWSFHSFVGCDEDGIVFPNFHTHVHVQLNG